MRVGTETRRRRRAPGLRVVAGIDSGRCSWVWISACGRAVSRHGGSGHDVRDASGAVLPGLHRHRHQHLIVVAVQNTATEANCTYRSPLSDSGKTTPSEVGLAGASGRRPAPRYPPRRTTGAFELHAAGQQRSIEVVDVAASRRAKLETQSGVTGMVITERRPPSLPVAGLKFHPTGEPGPRESSPLRNAVPRERRPRQASAGVVRRKSAAHFEQPRQQPVHVSVSSCAVEEFKVHRSTNYTAETAATPADQRYRLQLKSGTIDLPPDSAPSSISNDCDGRMQLLRAPAQPKPPARPSSSVRRCDGRSGPPRADVRCWRLARRRA